MKIIKEKITQKIMEQLNGLSCEELADIVNILNLELIKKLVHVEVQRIHIEAFKASYPPEL